MDNNSTVLIEDEFNNAAESEVPTGGKVVIEELVPEAPKVSAEVLKEQREKRLGEVLAHAEKVIKNGGIPKHAKESAKQQLLEKYHLYIEYGNLNGG